MPSKTQLPLFRDFEQLLSNFNDEGVDYLLIGGMPSWYMRSRARLGDVTEDYVAQPGNGFRMGRPSIMIEILTRIGGMEFPAARARAVMEDVNEAGLRVPIFSAADLITNKLAAGRLQDLADVEAVRQGVETRRAQQKEANAPAQGKDD